MVSLWAVLCHFKVRLLSVGFMGAPKVPLEGCMLILDLAADTCCLFKGETKKDPDFFLRTLHMVLKDKRKPTMFFGPLFETRQHPKSTLTSGTSKGL